MLQVSFKASFIRQLNKLDKPLQGEVLEKVELFKDKSNHKSLKVHKLHGLLKDQYSFSVNYKFRVVFIWANKTEATLLAVGDHGIYK